MIYVSSSCIKEKYIKDSVKQLTDVGIKNIELSGGTEYYHGYAEDLLELKHKYALNYTVHNYFPPPYHPFILNLASLDQDIYQKSIDHCIDAIKLCKKLGSRVYGVHAGFLIDFTAQEAGEKIGYRELNDRESALDNFRRAWDMLRDEAGEQVQLYVENNVISHTNKITYGENNPFLMTDYEGYLELRNRLDFRLLLDVAHLKVSCRSLGLNFRDQFQSMLNATDYLHVSGNDGLYDQNYALGLDDEMLKVLGTSSLSKKRVTIEVYDGLDGILSSQRILKEIIRH